MKTMIKKNCPIIDSKKSQKTKKYEWKGKKKHFLRDQWQLIDKKNIDRSIDQDDNDKFLII